jgi:hypothetical protein
MYYLEPMSANLIPDLLSPTTGHSKIPSQKILNQQTITSSGRRGKIAKEKINYGHLNQAPTAGTTETGQTAIETAQSNARATMPNVVLPKIPMSVRSIIKRSAQDSSSLDEIPNVFNNGNKEHFTKSVNNCEDDRSFCDKQVLNKDRLQQVTDFKLHYKMPWDSQDYNNYYYSDDETYIPGLHYRNVGFPHYLRAEGSSTHNYYAHPPQENINQIADAYIQTHDNVPNQLSSQFPGVIVLSLHKPTTTDLTGQSLSVTDNMQQESLAMSEDNVGNELEPIQEVKKNIFTSRGWGAGGMPYNILYMHPQQHVKPPSRHEVAAAQQLVAPLNGPTASQQYRQVAARNALNRAITAGSSGRGPTRAPVPTRRQYSIIPQLYVSYGWGPQGK